MQLKMRISEVCKVKKFFHSGYVELNTREFFKHHKLDFAIALLCTLPSLLNEIS